LSYLPLEELYQFGKLVQEAAHALERKVAVIASGDLSHCLKPGAPAGYDPRGEEFDRKLVELINEGAVKPFFELDSVLLEKAAECGFRSLIMLLGALDGIEFKSKVLSYQGPFGVGYGVASFLPKGERRSMIEILFQARKDKVQSRRATESPLVKYARQVVESFVKGEKLEESSNLSEYFRGRAGVFVSIKKHGQLRGCIGTIEPTQPDILQEIKENAISAATRDPRFEPITIDELNDLVYSVDLLKPAEPISGIDELDPERYGVIVKSGYRTGLLLPKLEGIENAAEQVAIARKKAGIGPNEPVKLERFEVIRYY
jgi:AmmeMemoRadiSam system protein A